MYPKFYISVCITGKVPDVYLEHRFFFQNPKPSHLEHEFDVTLKNKKQFSEVPHLEHGIM